MTLESTLAKIREEIERRGMSPTELERMAGISHRAAWAIHRGETSSISWENLDKCLAALGLKVL